VGAYRIVFEVRSRELRVLVVCVGHRTGVYRSRRGVLRTGWVAPGVLWVRRNSVRAHPDQLRNASRKNRLLSCPA